MKQETKLIHYKGSIDESSGAVSVPIYQVSTFRQDAVGRNLGYEYSRGDNSTRNVLEDYISELAGGEFGYAFSSGMAAISACLMCLKSGDSLVATEGLYGGTYRVLQRVFKDYSITCHYVDTGDLEGVRRGLDQGASAVLVETPSNPTMRITDIAEVGRLAHEYDAMVMADNTFMSPWLQRPLEWGADVVIHSATKYLAGHGDVLGGVIATSKQMRSEALEVLKLTGGNLGPHEAWLALRGMRTLTLRMRQHSENAMQVARWLDDHPRVTAVHYPGLPSHPQHALARALLQDAGYGGMVSFEIKDAGRREVFRFFEALSLCVPGTTLGDVHSLLLYPAHASHRTLSPEERTRVGIGEGLVRMSVGIEAVADIVRDLEQALATLG